MEYLHDVKFECLNGSKKHLSIIAYKEKQI